MSDATIITLTDAVVTTLNAASLSQSFTAVRKYRPEYELPDFSSLAVIVVPTRWDVINRDRNSDDTTCYVDVAVQQKVDVDDADEMDPLMYLMQEIVDLFARKTLASPAAQCIAREFVSGSEAGYAPEHTETLRQFTGVVRLTWRVL